MNFGAFNETPGLGISQNWTRFTCTRESLQGYRLYLRVLKPRLLHIYDESKSFEVPFICKCEDIIDVDMLTLYRIFRIRKCYSHEIYCNDKPIKVSLTIWWVTWINLTLACINRYTSKVGDKFTNPLTNCNLCIDEIWECIINIIPHYTGHTISYPCWH